MPKTWALITGASEGMGREFARIFARNGCSLILIARNNGRLAELSAELTSSHGIDVRIIATDLSSPAAAENIKASLDQLGICVEILVNNAGMGVYGLFHQTDWKATEAMINLNILATTHLTHLFLPGMLRNNQGKILNVSSTAAFQPGPLMASYFASKAYVLSFTEALANEVSGTAVTVSAFCPGPTRTQFQKRSGTEDIRENSFAMDAAAAAEIGYRGLMKGKTLVIPGFFNKLLAILVRFAPRKLVTRITRYIEEER